MSNKKLTTLLVVPNTPQHDPNDKNQEYALIHPQYLFEKTEPLWLSTCSSIGSAMIELQNQGHRKEFLDELFGKYQWESKNYIILDNKEALRYFKKTNKKNPQFSIDIIDELIAKYKAEGKSL